MVSKKKRNIMNYFLVLFINFIFFGMFHWGNLEAKFYVFASTFTFLSHYALNLVFEQN